jgi:hypothetical protein
LKLNMKLRTRSWICRQAADRERNRRLRMEASFAASYKGKEVEVPQASDEASITTTSGIEVGQPSKKPYISPEQSFADVLTDLAQRIEVFDDTPGAPTVQQIQDRINEQKRPHGVVGEHQEQHLQRTPGDLKDDAEDHEREAWLEARRQNTPKSRASRSIQKRTLSQSIRSKSEDEGLPPVVS